MDKPKKREGITENLAGTELFIYSEAGEQLIVLNASALFIWSLCDGAHDRSRMHAVLTEIYPDVDSSQLLHDLDECLALFQARGLFAPRI